LSLCVLILCFSSKALAWGTTGHRIVAEIAERHLNKKAKKEISKLIGKQSLANWANWADEIKSDTSNVWKHTPAWHYVNFPSNQNRAVFDSILAHYPVANLYSALLENEKILKDKTQPLEKRKIALYFIIHLMGDLEQPLHIGQQEDLGGNTIKVKWFSYSSNLHSVWDSQLTDYYKYSYTEYASFLDTCDKTTNEQLAAGNLEDWLFDSYLLANQIYKNVKDGDTLDYKYAYYMKDTLNRQFLKGGLRLAKVLNEALN